MKSEITNAGVLAANTAGYVPPGYRLTAAAVERVRQLAMTRNRKERRILLAQFRRKPVATFERDD